MPLSRLAPSRLALSCMAMAALLLLGWGVAAQPAPPAGWNLIREAGFCALGRDHPGGYVAMVKIGQAKAVFGGGYATTLSGIAVSAPSWPAAGPGETLDVDFLKGGRKIWTVKAVRAGSLYILAPNDRKGIQAINDMMPVSFRPSKGGTTIEAPVDRRDAMAAYAWIERNCRL